MSSPPASTKTSLGQRLSDRARQRWPALDRVNVRFRGAFAYVDAHLPNGEIMPLCRLRYGGSASIWGFAIYRASHDDYQDSFLPTGHAAGSPEEALDCACGLYLGEPTAWIDAITDTPTN
jgi:choline dehydrogenase-like flavoprotein